MISMRFRRSPSHWAWILLVLAALAIITGYGVTHSRRQAPADLSSGAGSAAPDPQAAAADTDAVATLFADALQKDEPLDHVLAAAQRNVERYPGFAAAHNLLAQIHVKRFEKQEAYHQLKLALDLDPNQAQVHALAGSVAEQMRDYDLAYRHYDQAASLEPANARFKLFLANTLIDRQQFDKARAMALEVLKTDANEHRAHAILARLFEFQGKPDQALEQIAKALTLTPAGEADRNTLITYTLTQAKLLRRLNRPQDAILAIQALRPRERINDLVLSDLATSYAMMNDPASAAKLYEDLALLSPRDWRYPAEAAAWRLKAGQLDQARDLLHRAKTLSPREPRLAELEADLRQAAP
jgi:tetratricopeptide (TPR) repeat protein